MLDVRPPPQRRAVRDAAFVRELGLLDVAALRRLERGERYLGGSRDGGAGPFPGLAAGASLTLGTTGGLVVKRTPRIGVGTEYHILGKFQAQAAAGDG